MWFHLRESLNILGSLIHERNIASETVSSGSQGQRDRRKSRFSVLLPLNKDSVSSFPTSEKPVIHIYFSYDYSKYMDCTLKIQFVLLQFGRFPMIEMNSHMYK